MLPLRQCCRCRRFCFDSETLMRKNRDGWTDQLCPSCGAGCYYDQTKEITDRWSENLIRLQDLRSLVAEKNPLARAEKNELKKLEKLAEFRARYEAGNKAKEEKQ